MNRFQKLRRKKSLVVRVLTSAASVHSQPSNILTAVQSLETTA